MNQSICNAISNKKVIEFYFKNGPRVVEPFCYGLSKKGKEILRGFQVGGYSESKNPVGWRLFDVDYMENLIITKENFSSDRRDYNPNDSMMAQIYCNV